MFGLPVSITNEFYNFRRGEYRRTVRDYGRLGENSAAALVFEDPKDAEATLAALHTIPSVSPLACTTNKAFFRNAMSAKRTPILLREAPRLVASGARSVNPGAGGR